MTSSLFNPGPFMPHGGCYLWTQSLIALHAISDAAIGLAYYSIPFTLLYFVRKRKDLKFRWAFVCFAAFVLACGTTHLMEIWNIWHADYWLSGGIKAITALVSVPTAFLLVRLIPHALALPSAHDLRKAHDELEIRVRERTAALVATTGNLQAEITERRRMETDLLRLAAIVESSDDAIIGKELAGRITSWNAGAARLFGYSADEMVGSQITRLLPLGRQSEEETIMDRIRRGERLEHFDTVRQTKDGRSLAVSVTVSAIRNASGQIIGASKVARDITERKRAAEALLQSEERFRLLFDRASDGIALLTADGRVVSTNQAFVRMHGYSGEEMAGMNVKDLNPPGTAKKVAERLSQVRAGEILTFETEHYHKAGHVFPIEISSSQITLDGVTYLQAFHRDITERKQAEAALRLSEERYRSLFENNPLPMFIEDFDSLRFMAVNEAAVRHYGYTKEEFLGMTVEQVCNPEDVPILLNRITQDRLGSESSGELRHRRKDGTVIHVETFSRPLTFDGRPARLVLATDITEKKLFEEKFLHAQRLESIGMLAAGIAHDLNNVLSPIVFSAPLLRTSLTTPRDVKILNTLEQSAGRGAGLVKQILGFAHSTTGERRPTQVKHLLSDIIGLIEETFPKSIQLEHHIPSDLWPVQGNATQLHQVLLNLCVNARDAMPAGGTLRLTAANRRLDVAEASALIGAQPGAWLMIEVTDTGTGIAPEVLEHIWMPFYTTKGVGNGTGLGLSTVRGIVSNHHGFVALDTKVSRGTTFRVFLPAIESESSRPASATPFASPSGHNELILVVDDESTIRDLTTDILAERGYRVVACADGLEALELFTTRAGEFSLILTDVDMPRLGGVALARAALLIRPDIRLIGMSGLSRNRTGGGDLPEIRKVAQGFLSKPFKPDELLNTIHGLLHPSTET